MDVLKHSEPKQSGAFRRFIHLLLAQAQQDQATEMVIGTVSPAGTPIRYKVEDVWCDLPPFPEHIRPEVISELVRMARFPAGQIPGEGILDESFSEMRLRWIVAMTSADGECMLTRVQD